MISLLLATLLGQSDAPPTSSGTPEKPAPKKSSTAPEDYLRALRQARPSGDVVRPGSEADAGRTAGDDQKKLLLPEGATWVDERGELVRDGDWWVFQSDVKGRSVRLLPNANLESMVRSFRGATSTSRFTVSGELTVFGGQSYLVVRSVTRQLGAALPANQPTVPAPRPATTAPADEVLQKMKALEPSDSSLGVDESESRGQPTAAGSRLLLDGTAVVRRVGRLTRHDNWWLFSSDSDHADSVDVPMRLLPNQALDMMIRDVEAGGASSFTLSGEATLFFGENYLLPRVATRKTDLGNLRK